MKLYQFFSRSSLVRQRKQKKKPLVNAWTFKVKIGSLFMIMCMRLHTSFQQDNLVVLREAHETRYHLCELNDLRYDRRQFLCRLHPQALLGLKSRKSVILLQLTHSFDVIVFTAPATATATYVPYFSGQRVCSCRSPSSIPLGSAPSALD